MWEQNEEANYLWETAMAALSAPIAKPSKNQDALDKGSSFMMTISLSS
jgi:hypothetical protein